MHYATLKYSLWPVGAMEEGAVAGDAEMRALDLIQNVTVSQCAEVRRRVLQAARRAGLGDDQASRFTLAVNEIVINAVTHGGGAVAVAVHTGPSSVAVEVSDQGSGIPDTVARELPPTDAIGGRGIWLARQLCDELIIDNRDEGAVVRLAVAR
jgi:serine/threonine-protein kinase RsbW